MKQVPLKFCVQDAAPSNEMESPLCFPTETTTVIQATGSIFVSLFGPVEGARCAELLTTYGDLRHVAAAHPQELRERGLSARMIQKLAALFEIARRHGEEEFALGAPFRGSYDIYAHFRERLAAETRELFIGVMLDNKNRKLKDILLSLGSLTSSVVHPRDVYAQVMRHFAAAVIFVHNHPSGDPTPSAEDIAITRRLREVGDLVGVRVLDHVVIGKGRYVSFVDDGYW